MNFACAVVVPGWAFLHSLIGLALGIIRPHFLNLPLSGMQGGPVGLAAIFGWVQ